MSTTPNDARSGRDRALWLQCSLVGLVAVGADFRRYLRSLHPPQMRLAIVLDSFSPHLTTKKDSRVTEWAAANNVEFADTPPTVLG